MYIVFLLWRDPSKAQCLAGLSIYNGEWVYERFVLYCNWKFQCTFIILDGQKMTVKKLLFVLILFFAN